MMKTLKQLALAMSMMAALLTGTQAATIDIPTKTGNYISWSNATGSNFTVENNGANVGSTGKNTQLSFSIHNAKQQDALDRVLAGEYLHAYDGSLTRELQPDSRLLTAEDLIDVEEIAGEAGNLIRLTFCVNDDVRQAMPDAPETLVFDVLAERENP